MAHVETHPTIEHHSEEENPQPIRVGVFSNLGVADRVVERLLDAGFTREQITVVCSNQAVQRHFESFHHQDPAGSHTKEAVVTGGAIGAVLGGLTGTAAAVATGGVGLLIAGGIALGAGGGVGGLVGAMMTRGIEKEVANYYDQAVLGGRILVAAEESTSNPTATLAEAERIFEDAGTEPLPMREG
jgi:hypothetical protein